MEQTCCCQRLKSCSAVIFVWQVHNESVMIWVSPLLKKCDLLELPNYVGWPSVGFLMKEGWVMLLSFFPTRDCCLHYPIAILLKGCPKQNSVVESSCDVMIVTCGCFSVYQLCSSVKGYLW